MDKDITLDEIFANDPFGMLNVKPKQSSAQNADERLRSSFQEINKFFKKHNREPKPNQKNISEYTLYSRLKSLRENNEKSIALEPEDKYKLLKIVKKEINSIDDILGDDNFGILDSDAEGIFELKHVTKIDERAKADFVARRKSCKDFNNYEHLFKEVQNDLATGKRRLIRFVEDNLREGDFYVHNGVLLLLKEIDFTAKEQSFKSGRRIRKDGRTHCIFENGTESNMLYRSLAKVLYVNGQVVTQNVDKVNEEFLEKFGNISEEDEEAGFIYVLKSESTDEKIRSIENLYKIGYSSTDVQERIKNAEQEPTYLMAPVSIEAEYKCYNVNPQKLEQLLHNFFGSSCLNIDVFDAKGNRHTPREWFIAPIHIIEQVIQMIISGEIVGYRYSVGYGEIVKKDSL